MFAATRLRSPRFAHGSPADAAARVPYLLAAAAAVLTMLLLPFRGFTLVGEHFEVLALTAALLVLAALCLRARGFGRAATLIEAWTLMTAFCVIVSVLLFVLAAGDLPLIDSRLAAADRMLMPWLDWPAAMRGLGRRPTLIDAGTACYASLRWQPLLLLVACVASGRADRCWTFLAAWMVALLVTAALFALLPAVGPYAHYAVARAAVPAMSAPAPWNTPGLVAALRDGSLRVVAFTDLDGIVTFPSFHTAAGVLLAWGFWSLRLLRWPMAALNLAMIAAAVPVGGHYVVDSLAGIAVAAGAILAGRRLVPEGQSPKTRAKIVSTCL